MPKVITYTLIWSSELQRYVLFDGSTPLDIIPESPAWFDWLDQTASFSFIIEQERYTLRKEKKQRGDAYWYAYHRVGKQLSKKYVGKSRDLTIAQLEVSICEQAAFHPSLAQRDDDCAPALTSGTSQMPVLAPKLHIPRLPPKLVSRARLLHLLEEQALGPLTLISAQAGAGKTTLVAEWATRRSTSVAWLALEPDDNQPTRFFSYLIAALQRLDPLIGTTSLPPLKSLQPPSLETILALLINEIAQSRLQPLILVLDDYHLMTLEAIHRAVVFLLDHLASHLHLLILTRSDPPLPLPRLRVRGQLVELRIDDLRFDNDETSKFLQAMTNRVLSAEDMHLLRERTEGWAAGLQLAALSLREKRDVSAFVREFAGSNRFVLDYLSEEILSRLPAPTLTFLLHTCILEHLSAPLCNALLGEELALSEHESQQMLETLEKANLFVTALDDEQHQYRYHALFASVLQAHLARTDPTRIPLLHQRACTWLEQHGFLSQAIHHALIIQDVTRITFLLRACVWDMFLRGEFDVVLGWLDRLPRSLEYTQPELCFYHATALACTGQSHLAAEYLKRAETPEQDQMNGTAMHRSVISAGERAALRTIIAVAQGDLAQARAARHAAHSGLPRHSIFLRGTMIGSEAIMAAIDGDFRLALQYVWQAGQIHLQSNNPFIIQRDLLGQVLFLTHLGQRRQVTALCERGMRLVTTVEESRLLYTGSLSLFLGMALYENNKLEAAKRRTQQGIELCEQIREKGLLPMAYALLAQILYLEQCTLQHTSSPSQEVLQLMQQAETLLMQQPPMLLWSRQHAVYILVRLWIVQRNQEALARLERFYPVDGEIGATPGSSYAAQTETWGLAYIRFGQQQPEETVRWLHWPIQAAEQAGRRLALMRMLILHALAYQALGQTAEALGAITRALQYAEPEGYSTMFVEMGQPMTPLLQPLLERTETSSRVPVSFLHTVLRELGVPLETEPPIVKQPGEVDHCPPTAQEPLTEREREILRLLGAGLSNQAIAEHMVVEVSTVKWHIRHIYAKLHVNNRTQALLQAQERGLLA